LVENYKPILRYRGSKARIAAWVVAHFPAHEVYCEPFFGGGSVLFSKPQCKTEVVNDLSSAVVNLFRCLRDQPEELARQIEMTPWAREEYEECREPASDLLEQAAVR
jgi:DNA adenine methylase